MNRFVKQVLARIALKKTAAKAKPTCKFLSALALARATTAVQGRFWRTPGGIGEMISNYAAISGDREPSVSPERQHW